MAPAAPEVASTPGELSPEWVTAALRHSGSLAGDIAVVDVTLHPVGTGQMGDSVRLALTYDGPTAAPPTLVAKQPAVDPTSRATAVAGRSYEIEVRFYQQLAATLPVRTPRAYYADVVAGTADFVLLLEDVAPARQGDQVAGCTPDEAALAVEELIGLHAPRWGDPGLANIEWLDRSRERRTLDPRVLVPELWKGFVGRYAHRLDDDIVAMGERFMGLLGPYYDQRPGPWTVMHNDYRLDNLLFGTADGGPPITIVDWQTVSRGPGMLDVAYFIGAGLRVEDRRRHEEDLVRIHHRGLAAVDESWTWDRCWAGYRRYAYAGFHMAVLASMIVQQTDRGDDMFVTMAQRHGRQVIDLRSEDLLGEGTR